MNRIAELIDLVSKPDGEAVVEWLDEFGQWYSQHKWQQKPDIEGYLMEEISMTE